MNSFDLFFLIIYIKMCLMDYPAYIIIIIILLYTY